MRRLSGSKVRLALLCVHPFLEETVWDEQAIPDFVKESDTFKENPEWVGKRQNGVTFHGCIEDLYEGNEIDVDLRAALAGIEPDAVEDIKAYVEAWKDFYAWGADQCPTDIADAKPEVAYAFDPREGTARALGKLTGPRAYKEAGVDRSKEIPLTLDLVYVEPAKRFAVIRDWKTGAQRERESIEEHAQLRLGAYCVARAHDLDSVTIVVAYATEATVFEYSYTLTKQEIDAIGDRLFDMAMRYDMQDGPRPGRHCRSLFCPVRFSCVESWKDTEEAAVNAIDELPPEVTQPAIEANLVLAQPGTRFPMTLAIQSKEHAGWLRHRAMLVREMAERVLSAVNEYAIANGPCPQGDGTFWGLAPSTSRTLSLTPEALDVLKTHLGDIADQALSRPPAKITFDAIEQATKLKVGKGKKRTALERDILDHLSEVGALKFSQYEKLDVIRPEKE